MKNNLPKSTRAGIEAFLKKYGEVNLETMCAFLNITESEWIEKYWPIWKDKFERRIN